MKIMKVSHLETCHITPLRELRPAPDHPQHLLTDAQIPWRPLILRGYSQLSQSSFHNTFYHRGNSKDFRIWSKGKSIFQCSQKHFEQWQSEIIAFCLAFCLVLSKYKIVPFNVKLSDVIPYLELFQRLLEHVWLHHRGRKYCWRHQTRPDRLPQVIQSCETHQTSQKERFCQNSPLHICSIIQGAASTQQNGEQFAASSRYKCTATAWSPPKNFLWKHFTSCSCLIFKSSRLICKVQKYNLTQRAIVTCKRI